MSLPLDSVGRGIMFWAVPFVRSFVWLSVCPVIYCYHDALLMAWRILIELTWNIYYPLVMTWLDS